MVSVTALSYSSSSPTLKIPIPTPRHHCHHQPNQLRSLSRSHSRSLSHTERTPPSTTPIKSFGFTAIFVALGLGFASSVLTLPPVSLALDHHSISSIYQDDASSNGTEHRGTEKDEKERDRERELEEAFEKWKSKSYALTVPLRIIALRGSVPPPWIKDFIASQGRRVKLMFKLRESLGGIFSDMSADFRKGNVKLTSVAAADLVTLGDSWLSFAVKKEIIEPIEGLQDKEWFTSLSDKWKVYLCRNSEGEIDPKGKIWAAPYRWGSMVIAYKRSKLEKLNITHIEDWADLWRPELAGRISMVDCPREVVGAVLKYMGASYNTDNIDLKVPGGKNAVQQNLTLLAKQVRLFDSKHYLKAFGAGDVWVAVGWSNDVLSSVKRMRNVAVVVPKSGASLWADLWAIPAASSLQTNQIGGRIRGPSPVIHQWIEFCLQTARALPFVQGVIPGAIPAAIEGPVIQLPKEFTKGKPRLDTNLVAGVPPAEILARCEFLEPLSDAAVSDYQWLIDNMRKKEPGLIENLRQRISAMLQMLQHRLHLKLT